MVPSEAAGAWAFSEEEPSASSEEALKVWLISSYTLLKFADMIFTVSSSREVTFHWPSTLIIG